MLQKNSFMKIVDLSYFYDQQLQVSAVFVYQLVNYQYFNYFRMEHEKSKEIWTEEEQAILFKMHNELGNKWLTIANQLCKKSDNCVKNHYYAKLRKSIRRLNKIISQKFKKQHKEIKPTTLIKLVQATQQKFKENSSVSPYIIDLSINIKNKLLKLESNYKDDNQQFLKEVEQILKQIQEFNQGYKKQTKESKRIKDGNADDFLQIQKPKMSRKVKSINNLHRTTSQQDLDSGSGIGLSQQWVLSSQSSYSSKTKSLRRSRTNSRSRSRSGAISTTSTQKQKIQLEQDFGCMQINSDEQIKRQNHVEKILLQAGMIEEQHQQQANPIYRTGSRLSMQSQGHNDIFKFQDSQFEIRMIPPIDIGARVFNYYEANQKNQQQFNLQ